MERSLRHCLALILASLQILGSLRLGQCLFTCDCFKPYENYQSQSSCETVRTVLQCYNDNKEVCDESFLIGVFLGLVMGDFQELGCGDETTTSSTIESFSGSGATPELTTLPPPLCPTVPEITENPAVSMSEADIFPKLHSSECTMRKVSHLRQCSLFMDSQLRPFASGRRVGVGLEACSLPGAWFLFRHQDLFVEVEGMNLEPGYNHTRLTKVKVTFHTHDCNPVMRTYTAYNTEPLASQFTPPYSENTTSPLQLMFGQDGSVVTLMATWLNASIIIRQYAQFLSVTLQVPRELALESEGLCTGCPSDLYINVTAFNDLVSSLCDEVHGRTLLNCYDYGGVTNRFPIENVVNNSYWDSCVYSMLKIKRAEVLTMFNAIAGDAALLMDVGVEPTTSPPPPPLPPDFNHTPPRNIQKTTTNLLVSTSDSSSSLQTQSFPALAMIVALTTLTLSVSR